MTVSRRGYGPGELKQIDKCLKNGSSLRALAEKIGRNYAALWRFAASRGGTSAVRAKEAGKHAKAVEIRAVHRRLQRQRKVGRTPNTVIANEVGCDRRLVAKVLGKSATQRTSSAGKP
jgi:hypothetical protein